MKRFKTSIEVLMNVTRTGQENAEDVPGIEVGPVLAEVLPGREKSTGMGLHIVKKMVENAEGKIEAESQVGIGSTLKVYFKS